MLGGTGVQAYESQGDFTIIWAGYAVTRLRLHLCKTLDYGDFLMTTKAIYFGGTEHESTSDFPTPKLCVSALRRCGRDMQERWERKIFAPQHVAECGWFLFNILQALAAKESV